VSTRPSKVTVDTREYLGSLLHNIRTWRESPFNDDRIALVSEVTGDGKRNPFSILCAEE
jgi:hypothetical protein